MIEPDSYLYAYSITRDFGFAPNPFLGLCTLATCKPGIRKGAKIGDWILGVGGSQLGSASKKAILLMKVTEKTNFQGYWDNPRYALKKSLRNGSPLRMLGDNIYHKDDAGNWIQEDSHHSNPDGTANIVNLTRDTGSTDSVLLSDFFLYFGNAAITVDLNSIGYHRIRNYKKIQLNNSDNARDLIKSCVKRNRENLNVVISDPCQFNISHKRVNQATGKLV
ncbi:MAG: hypothetical protein RPU32_13760 [Candidatus Sedimenticola sp. (ex Thyasira tokunagai)]